jgi:hypothetical protein
MYQLALSSADDVGNYLADSTLSLTASFKGNPSGHTFEAHTRGRRAGSLAGSCGRR